MGRKITKGGEYRPAVALRREAKDRLSQWCEDHDEEIGKTLSKLALWFTDADPIVQAVVLRRPVAGVVDAYAAALRTMADEIEAAKPDFQADDNINPILHPERPEQVLKPKKKRAG